MLYMYIFADICICLYKYVRLPAPIGPPSGVGWYGLDFWGGMARSRFQGLDQDMQHTPTHTPKANSSHRFR